MQRETPRCNGVTIPQLSPSVKGGWASRGKTFSITVSNFAGKLAGYGTDIQTPGVLPTTFDCFRQADRSDKRGKSFAKYKIFRPKTAGFSVAFFRPIPPESFS